MKNLFFCVFLFYVNAMFSQNNAFAKREFLPIYFINNDTLNNIIDKCFMNAQQQHNTKKNIFFLYIGFYSDSTYEIALHVTERSLLYVSKYLYKHTKIQQFVIEYKKRYIPAYFERFPRDVSALKDTVIFKLPFLSQTNRNLHVWLKAPPAEYYDNTYLGEGVLEKHIASWHYTYKNGVFEHSSSFVNTPVPTKAAPCR